MRGAAGLVVLLLVVYAVAGIGSSFTAPAVREWYPSLIKPSFSPPSWVFGPVWTVLYAMMAVSAWLLIRRGEKRQLKLPMVLFGVQLALNLAWSILFFGLRRPDLGMVDIILLWLAILATMLAFWRIKPLAGALLIPYLLWVSFAAVLNFELWRLNG
ncbi:MAG: TspO/MBR family protein [Armatimonadota bacterium]